MPHYYLSFSFCPEFPRLIQAFIFVVPSLLQFAVTGAPTLPLKGFLGFRGEGLGF